MNGRSGLVGWLLILAGMFYLTLPTLVKLPPLATVSVDTPIGSIEIRDISEFSAINIFIGIALIAIGVFVIMKRRAVY